MSSSTGEKKEMQGLNSKLAVYIERMRQRELGTSNGVTYEEISSVIDMFERNVTDLRGSLDEAHKENTRLKVELGKYKSQADTRDELRRRISKLEKELAAAREKISDLEATLSFQVEEKRILRSNLESQIETLNRQLIFKDKDLKDVRAELKRLLKGNSLDIETISSQIRVEYDEKLEKLRRDLHEQHKYELDHLRIQLESQYSSEKSRLVVRIKELEMQLEKERDLHNKQMQALRGDRDTLEREIKEYRKLLESEESRLKVDLTPNTRKKRQRVVQSMVAKSNKRRREAVSDTISSSSSTGLVAIIDADPNGKYIQLQHHSSEADDQSMGGWAIQRKVDDEDAISYKFPTKFILKKEKEVTVWASGAGHSHSPPDHLVHRSKESWGSGDHMETTLVDAKGEVMASSVVERDHTTSYQDLESEDADDVDGYNEMDGEEGSRCLVM